MGKIVYDKLLGQVLLHVHDPLYLRDSNGIYWLITVDTAGALVITQQTAPATLGTPIGLLLCLTYAT